MNHAFASPHGRFRYIESLADEDGNEGSPTDPIDWEALGVDTSLESWEWFNLAGGPGLYNADGIELRPEHRLGNAYRDRLEFQRDAAAAIADESLLYRTLVGDAIYQNREDIISAFETVDEFARYFRNPVRGVELITSTPTELVRIELEFRVLRNRQYKVRQHDRGDILLLAQAIPYADVVWPDKHWGHIARSAGLGEQFDTVLPRSAKHLGDVLAAWA